MTRALFSILVSLMFVAAPVVLLGWVLENEPTASVQHMMAVRVWNAPPGLAILVGLMTVAVSVLINAYLARKEHAAEADRIRRSVAGAIMGEVRTNYETCRIRYLRLNEMAPNLDPKERLRVPSQIVPKTFAPQPDRLTYLPAPVVEDVTTFYGRLDELNTMVSDLISASRLAPDGELMRVYWEVLTISERLMMSLSNLSHIKPPVIDPLPEPGQAATIALSKINKEKADREAEQAQALEEAKRQNVVNAIRDHEDVKKQEVVEAVQEYAEQGKAAG